MANAQVKVGTNGNVLIGSGTPGSTNKLEINGVVKITLESSGSGVITIDNSGYAGGPNIYGMATVGGYGHPCYDMNSYYFTVPSDERLKENIRDISNGLDLILKLDGKRYDYKTDTKDDKKISELKKDQVGFLAQDVVKIIPETVLYDDSADIYSIDYTKFIPFITEAIKEQQQIIENLQSENQELKNKVSSIEANCCNASLKSASTATGTTNNTTGNAAQLDQNIPNPFSKETQIGCFIPEGSGTSILYIYNMNGTQLQQYSITGKGKQSVTINSNSFVPGMYLYALVIDGKEVDTKRMILTK